MVCPDVQMWSYVQHRQIKKQVEHDWRSRTSEPHQNENQDSLHKLESGRQHRTSSVVPLTPNLTDKDQTADHHWDAKGDRILVECKSSEDPLDPRNWPLLHRARTITILSLLVFTQAWAGSADSLANSKASKQYHVSPVAENLSTAMYLFGIGSGCLFVGPLSEAVGRNPVYLAFSFVYLFFVLGAALSETFASQIVCRYFVGLASSATLGINGASVGDMFRPVKRAGWFPLIGWVNVVRKYCHSFSCGGKCGVASGYYWPPFG